MSSIFVINSTATSPQVMFSKSYLSQLKEESGAQVSEVEEPFAPPHITLFRSEPVFQVVFDVIAEPKALLANDLKELVKKHGGFIQAARAIGTSESFVWQKARRYKRKKRP